MVIGLSATQWYFYLKGSIPFPSVMSHFSFHIYEFFWRIFYILLPSFLSFLMLGAYFKEVSFYFICIKADLSFIILSHPFEGFLSFLSFSSFLSIFLIFLPLLILHLYIYFRPIRLIYRTKRGELLGMTFMAFLPIISFYLALILLPSAIKILISPLFGKNTMNSLFIFWVPQIKGIINLLILLSFFIFIYLLIPIILISLQILFGNPHSQFFYKEMGKWRPMTIIIIMTGISIITPPDLITLLITGLPLILLLELTFFISLIVFKYFSFN